MGQLVSKSGLERLVQPPTESTTVSYYYISFYASNAWELPGQHQQLKNVQMAGLKEIDEYGNRPN